MTRSPSAWPTGNERAELNLVPLPTEAEALCNRLGAPPRLVAHLTLVHDMAHRIVRLIEAQWPSATLDTQTVLFGAATHDIGKAHVRAELSGPGHTHERLGFERLVQAGIPTSRARFTITHAAWEAPDATLEDRLVALADKLWKGSRNHELELAVATDLAGLLSSTGTLNHWEIFDRLSQPFDRLAEGAPRRLQWQQRFSTDAP